MRSRCMLLTAVLSLNGNMHMADVEPKEVVQSRKVMKLSLIIAPTVTLVCSTHLLSI